MLLMGKLTISMAIFNSFLLTFTRGYSPWRTLQKVSGLWILHADDEGFHFVQERGYPASIRY